jgi:YidC/Oxa1 family membrane protein insertase
MSPLDFWQKSLMRKNNKAMKIMKPKLEQIKKESGDNQQLYLQKQQALYKQHGYSMLGACLPTIVTLVLFIIILGGFTAMVKYQNQTTFEYLKGAYEEEYGSAYADYKTAGDSDTQADEKATADAQALVQKEYQSKKDSFLWVKNIFMPDTPWSAAVPDWGIFSGTGGGFLGMGRINVDVDKLGWEQYDYDKVMGSIVEEEGAKVNGFLILPLICLLLNVLMMKLNPQSAQQPAMAPSFGQNSEASAKSAQMSSKMMIYMMPAMMFVFAMFYSSAFTLYLTISTTFSIVFNYVYNTIAKKKDKVEEEVAANTTYVRKSELEAIKKHKEKEEREKLEKEKDEKAKKILEKTQSKFKDIDKL